MYDPFVENQIPFNQPPTDSYWNAKGQTITTKTLDTDIQTDVLIVGAGYTGLSCAIELANAGIKNITVIAITHSTKYLGRFDKIGLQCGLIR